MPCTRASVTVALGLSITCATVAGADEGTVVIEKLDSPAVATNRVDITSVRRVFVYLPPGYADTTRSYPTLYWSPGWQTPASREYIPYLNAAISSGRIPPTIVGHLDVSEGVIMMNSDVFGAWEDFLTQELVPYIDGEYRTVAHERGRALMGHSSGGYAAILLPLRYPGIWGAVGLNDASLWAGCTAALPYDMPNYFGQYDGLRSYTRAWTQIAIAMTPNPQSPRLFDTPATADDYTQAKATWDAHCLWRPATARAQVEALSRLSKIAIVIPTDLVNTNRMYGLLFTRALDDIGIEYAALEMPGTHGGDRPSRFIALAEEILPTLRQGHPTAARSRLDTWASIRTSR
ncbi:hypothetical protein CMK11_07805 [Candidatus Poribacteria bacterium]|nr:hypothetical protein [Candidatus Poribacteria bacterium]